MAKLSDLYKNKTGSQFSSFFGFPSATRTLPNGGGTYQTPTPEASMWGQSMVPAVTPPPAVVPPVVTPAKTQTPAATSTPVTPPARSKYINPATGTYFATAKEYGDYVASKLPVSKGDIPQFAGDQLTQGPQTTEQTTATTAALNNARNDIATGTTDPYKVGNQSGIAYSPQELAAIEKAYAGIYDPAINTALAKLDAAQRKEDAIFSTNENIRQYNATTGQTAGNKKVGSLGLKRGADGYVAPEEYLAKANEYESSGKTMSDFVKDYPPKDYINPDDVASLPTYLQPASDTQADRTAQVWKELSRPEVQALSDEEKASIIRGSYGLNPETFGLYGV